MPGRYCGTTSAPPDAGSCGQRRGVKAGRRPERVIEQFLAGRPPGGRGAVPALLEELVRRRTDELLPEGERPCAAHAKRCLGAGLGRGGACREGVDRGEQIGVGFRRRQQPLGFLRLGDQGDHFGAFLVGALAVFFGGTRFRNGLEAITSGLLFGRQLLFEHGDIHETSPGRLERPVQERAFDVGRPLPLLGRGSRGELLGRGSNGAERGRLARRHAR